jgi:hypothetical protein
MPRISWSTAIHQTPTIQLVEYSSVPNLLLIYTPYLEPDRNYEEDTNEPEGEEVYYAKPDPLGGIEGIDYDIVYGIQEEETRDITIWLLDYDRWAEQRSTVLNKLPSSDDVKPSCVILLQVLRVEVFICFDSSLPEGVSWISTLSS